MPRIHHPGAEDHLALCGQPWPELSTAEPGDVTCRRCRKRIARGEASAAGRPPAPLGPVTEYTSGAHELGPGAVRAIERSRRGDTPRAPRWRHPEHAVRAWVAMRDQSVLRSSGDYSADRVQSNRAPSAGGILHSRIEVTRNVGLALSRAVRDEGGLRDACPALSPQAALGAYLMRVGGKGISKRVAERKGRYPHRSHRAASEVAFLVAEDTGAEVDERHVADLVRHFNGWVRAALIASGEMAGPPGRDVEPKAWDALRRLREDAA